MKRARILLADDHRLVAEALKTLLSAEFEFVGVVEDGRTLIRAARELHPDIIVADVAMPGLNGIDALIEMKKDEPAVRVVFLTMHPEVAYARRALDAGAKGYVLKHSAPAELVAAIRSALAGKTYITPALAGELLEAMKREPTPAADPLTFLTPRQRQVLQLIAEGRSARSADERRPDSPRHPKRSRCPAEYLTGSTRQPRLLHTASAPGGAGRQSSHEAWMTQ